MNHKVRMLHTSDVHIGHVTGPGDRHADICQCPILGLAAAIGEYQADLLMIAGDLFDHARLSESAVGATLELLTGPGVPVVVIPGNHDVHDTKSLWQRCRSDVDRTGIHLLDQIEGSAFVHESKQITIWGRAMTDHEPSYRPLGEVPSRPNKGWYVVAAHGHLNLSSEDAHRSSPITYEEISATKADYVALGHWHLPTDASHGGVTAWYPGAPMGSPGNGSAALVTFENETTVEHVPISVPAQGCR
jgi:DNA repair exonuclease SbcCD nuclease subunit